MKEKALVLLLTASLFLFAATGCGREKSNDNYFLNSNEVNYFMLEENPQNLEALGEAMDGTENINVALDAPSSDYILNSLSSIGEIQTKNLKLDFNFNGEGDFSKLTDLSTLKGLTSLTIAGINNFNDTSVFTALEDLTLLTLKDQEIDDYTPLNQCKSLTTLCLSGENINYETLLDLQVKNIEIPVAKDNWLALTLLKSNPTLETINTVNKDTFTLDESLEPAEKYYYYQLDAAITLTTTKKELINVGEGDKPTIRGSLVVAAPWGLLQPNYYHSQKLLNTACGFSESDTDPQIFFPYIQSYEEAGIDSTYLKLAGTPVMAENYITAIDVDEAKFAAYIYVLDEGGNFTTDYTKGQLWIYAQICDLENKQAYEPYLIYQSVLGTPDKAEAYQKAILDAFNQYLSSLEIEAL